MHLSEHYLLVIFLFLALKGPTAWFAIAVAICVLLDLFARLLFLVRAIRLNTFLVFYALDFRCTGEALYPRPLFNPGFLTNFVGVRVFFKTCIAILLLIALTGRLNEGDCSFDELNLFFGVSLLVVALSSAAFAYYSYKITENNDRANPFPKSVCSHDTLTYRSTVPSKQMIAMVCRFSAQNAWIRKLHLSFPRDASCFSLLGSQLCTNNTLHAITFADMELVEEDIAAVAGALIAPNSRSRVERLEFLDCSFSYRSLHALKTFTSQPSALRDLIIRTSNSFEPSAVRSMLQEVAVPRVSIDLKMNEVVSAGDFPFGPAPPVDLS